jgi:hypothetical protein
MAGVPTTISRPESRSPDAREETRREIARCAQLHERIEADRATLAHECYVQAAAMRRLDSRMSMVAHLPLRHAAQMGSPRRIQAPARLASRSRARG